MKSKKSYFNSIGFKSWLYFVLFALSILLILEILQIVLIEPFYLNTLTQEIKSYNHKISEIYFSETTEDENQNIKTTNLYSLTMDNNACAIIYDADTGTTVSAFDVLGESGCAIYNNSTVNPTFIEALNNDEDGEILMQGPYIELSNQSVMVYGKKYIVNDVNYYIITNFTLQSLNILSKTIQEQFIIIILIVLALSLLISLLFSRLITRPIVQVQNEAEKLTYGNYDVHFDNYEINEINDLAETIELAAGEVSRFEIARNELLANVTHDLKTPLTMIKAYAEMIKDISGDNKKNREEHLDIIISETDYLNNLVSDILNLSRLQAKAVSINICPFDLSGLLQECENRFKALAQKENINLLFECETELVALADEAKINEVLVNFISNAFKHIGEDRIVLVKAFLTDQNTIRIEVIDHGSGIDENVLPYIWDRYYKVDRQYQRSKTGTGLGLAINKAILEAHKAKYGVQSVKEKGSTFYFELEPVNLEENDD